jgi:hypothetical protein
MLKWNLSWHYIVIKKDALQKGLPVSDKAAVRERVLTKSVEAPDLATVKDFLHFYVVPKSQKWLPLCDPKRTLCTNSSSRGEHF